MNSAADDELLPLYVTLDDEPERRSSRLGLVFAATAVVLSILGVVLVHDGHSGQAVVLFVVNVVLSAAALVVDRRAAG